MNKLWGIVNRDVFIIFRSDIIQKMTGYQESAFEKLKVWISAEARSLKREVPEITPLMKYAMTVAKRREGILQYFS